MVADAGMFFDAGEFLVRQLPGLVENLERDFGLADVVQQTGERQGQDVRSSHAGIASERGRNPGHDEAVLESAFVITANRIEPLRETDFSNRVENLMARLLDRR